MTRIAAAADVTWFKDAHVQTLAALLLQCGMGLRRTIIAAVFCSRFIITGSSGHYTSVVAAVEVSGRIANTSRMDWIVGWLAD